MQKAQAQTKLKIILSAICEEQNQRFYTIELAKTKEGTLEIACDSKTDEIYLMFAGERIAAPKALRILSGVVLAKINLNGKKEN